jgi:hypothetical protein
MTVIWSRVHMLIALTCAGLGLALLAPGAQAAVVGTVRASVSTRGAQADRESYFPHLSGDGRYVAFTSPARNLADCPDGFPHVYVRDLALGSTECFLPFGEELQARSVAISSNGRYVLIQQDEDNALLRWDRQTGRVIIASVPADGPYNDPHQNRRGTLSRDGHVVAFFDSFPGLASHPLTVRNLDTGDAYFAPQALGSDACLSSDGRFAFYDGFTKTLHGDVPAFLRYDRQTRTIRYAGPPNKGDAGAHRRSESCSADGSKVAYRTPRGFFVATLTAKDLRRERVDLTSDGTPANAHEFSDFSPGPALSPDGNYVVFESAATNLVRDDNNGLVDLFAHNMTTGVTWRVNRGLRGVPRTMNGFGDYTVGTAASGHSVIAYATQQDNLVPNDTNGLEDVFVTSLG